MKSVARAVIEEGDEEAMPPNRDAATQPTTGGYQIWTPV